MLNRRFWFSFLKSWNDLKIIDTWLQISQVSEHVWSSLGLTRNFCQILSFDEYGSVEITQPVFYGDQVYKIRRVESTANCISSGSKKT